VNRFAKIKNPRAHARSAAEAGTIALAALCLTSRRLGHAATRPLYHRPITTKWWLLAHTLLTRPELAHHVKTLQFFDSLDYPKEESAVSPLVLSYYNTQLTTYATAAIPEADENNYNRRAQFLRQHPVSAFLDGESADQVSLITNLCPAAERVEADTDYGWGVLHFCAPDSMLALHTVELVHPDPEGGLDLGSLVPLFRAAPNLRVVRCQGVANEDGHGLLEAGVRMEGVREVEFQYSAVGIEALRAVLTVCTQMETFRYSAGGATVGYEQFDPCLASDLFMGYNMRGLKKVVLDFAHAEEPEWYELWVEWEEEDKEQVVKAFRERGVEMELLNLD
jgi:hypothetical protein